MNCRDIKNKQMSVRVRRLTGIRIFLIGTLVLSVSLYADVCSQHAWTDQIDTNGCDGPCYDTSVVPQALQCWHEVFVPRIPVCVQAPAGQKCVSDTGTVSSTRTSYKNICTESLITPGYWYCTGSCAWVSDTQIVVNNTKTIGYGGECDDPVYRFYWTLP
jgi:hypothetical protein